MHMVIQSIGVENKTLEMHNVDSALTKAKAKESKK